MVNRFSPLILALAALSACQQTAAPRAMDSDATAVTTPDGVMTCSIPHMPDADPVQRQASPDGSGAIVATGAFGELYRAEYMRIPPEQIDNFRGERQKAGVKDAFTHYVLPLFQSVSPDTQVLAEEYTQLNNQPAYFAVVTIPGGSPAVSRDGNGTIKRADSTRAILVFVSGDCLVVTMHGLSVLGFDPATTQNGQLDPHVKSALQNQIISFAATVHIK